MSETCVVLAAFKIVKKHSHSERLRSTIFCLVWWSLEVFVVVSCFSFPPVVEATCMDRRHSPIKEACLFLWAASALPGSVRSLASSDM